MKVFLLICHVSAQLDGWSWSSDTSVQRAFSSLEKAEQAVPIDNKEDVTYEVQEIEVE